MQDRLFDIPLSLSQVPELVLNVTVRFGVRNRGQVETARNLRLQLKGVLGTGGLERKTWLISFSSLLSLAASTEILGSV